jgi:NeuB family
MVRAAKDAAYGAVKFQTFKAAQFVNDVTLKFTYRSQGREVTEPMLDMLHRYELPQGAWGVICAVEKKALSPRIRGGVIMLGSGQARPRRREPRRKAVKLAACAARDSNMGETVDETTPTSRVIVAPGTLLGFMQHRSTRVPLRAFPAGKPVEV